MTQPLPSTNQPFSAWLPDEAWRPIADPEFREQRRELEKRIGRDLGALADRVALDPYGDALICTTGLYGSGDPAATLDDARRVDLSGPASRDDAAYRKAIESVAPAGDLPLLVALRPNIHSRFVLPMTWRRYAEHFTPLAAWALATDGSWLFLHNENEFAVSGRPRAGVVHRIAHIENYRANKDAVVPFERLVIRHGQDQCWESMRIGYGGDAETNHAFARALSWLTGVPIERHELDPGDPTQQPTA